MKLLYRLMKVSRNAFSDYLRRQHQNPASEYEKKLE